MGVAAPILSTSLDHGHSYQARFADEDRGIEGGSTWGWL